MGAAGSGDLSWHWAQCTLTDVATLQHGLSTAFVFAGDIAQHVGLHFASHLANVSLDLQCLEPSV